MKAAWIPFLLLSKIDMADPKPTLPGSKGNDVNMERNLLIAFVLMGVVLFVTPFFMKQNEPPAASQKKGGEPKMEAGNPSTPVPTTAADAKPPAAATTKDDPKAAAPAAVSDSQEREFPLETKYYKIRFSNRGAVVKSWVLKNYKDSNGKPLELINLRAAPKVGHPFALAFPGTRPETDVNTMLFAHRFPEGGNAIEFEYADARVRVKKTFRLDYGDYRAQVASEVIANGAAIPHNLNWKGGFGDNTVYNAASTGHTVHFNQKLIIKTIKETAEGAPVADRGTFPFAGIEDTYFAAVFFPRESRSFELRTYADTVQNKDGGFEPFVGASVGGEGRNDFSLFVGPKDLEVMRHVDPRLEQLIDWGSWFGWLAKPLFSGLMIVHNWVKTWAPQDSYGWAIVLVTVIINFALLPLKISSLKSMKKMSVIQPEIAKINKKYEGLGLKDPRKQQQNEEVMALYKKHGVNPAGGCVPLLLQMPFLFAFLTVLNVAIQMRQATWLWVGDLSQPETIPIRILPLLMIASQFVLQKMTPSTSVDPTQQRMMLIMPLVFGFMFYGASSGLVLYWLVGNVIALIQQWFFNRFL